MRTLPILFALGAALSPGAVMAQPVAPDVPPSSLAPQSAADVAPVEQVPSSAALPGARPGPDGVIRQWGPQQAIVENAPPPAESYPPCTRAQQDSCTNPDPSRELDYYPADKTG